MRTKANLKPVGQSKPATRDQNAKHGAANVKTDELVLGMQMLIRRLTLVENPLVMEAGEDSKHYPEPNGQEHQRRLLLCKTEAAVYYWYSFSKQVDKCPADRAHDRDDENDGLGEEQSDRSSEGQNHESLEIGSMVWILDAKM